MGNGKWEMGVGPQGGEMGWVCCLCKTHILAHPPLTHTHVDPQDVPPLLADVLAAFIFMRPAC